MRPLLYSTSTWELDSFKYICLAVRTNLPAILNNRSRMVFTWSPRHFLSKQQVFRKLKRLRSEEHTSELQSRFELVCRLLLEKKENQQTSTRAARKLQ